MTLADIKNLRFTKFLIIGLSNTALSYGVFILFLNLLADMAAPAAVAQAIGYATGIVWSYFWNRKWTFESRKPVLKEGAAFLLSQLGLMALSSLSLYILIDHMNLQPTMSWIMVMGGITILNFLILKKCVYTTDAETG